VPQIKKVTNKDFFCNNFLNYFGETSALFQSFEKRSVPPLPLVCPEGARGRRRKIEKKSCLGARQVYVL